MSANEVNNMEESLKQRYIDWKEKKKCSVKNTIQLYELNLHWLFFI